jgi:hypothetical protein
LLAAIETLPPQDLQVAYQDEYRISLSWVAPSQTFGSAVINYRLESFDGSSWELIDVPTSTAYTIIVGIVTGDEYQYRVNAVNEIGPSDYSDTIYVIAAREPETPTSFSIIDSTESSLEFMWQEPYNGGTPIIYYKVYQKDVNDNYLLYAFTVGPDNIFLVNNGLTAGEFFSYKVIAVNAVGESPLSEVFTYIAAAKPGTPGKPYWTSRSATTIDLEWLASEPNGSAIQFYNIYASVNSGQY